MSELESGNESGASPESTVSSESASPVQTQETGNTQEAVTTQEAPKEAPFHEHPRFKELIEQNRGYKDQLEQMQRSFQTQMQQLQQQYKQTSPNPQQSFKDEYVNYLKNADPKFAEYQAQLLDKIEGTSKLEHEIAELKQYQQSYQQQQAISQFDKLCTDNKVSETDKEFYRQAIANAANARGAKISELPALFKEAHDTLGKYFAEKEKAITAKYVTQKTGDKKPTTQTGGTAVAANKSIASKDDVKAAFAKAIKEGGLRI